MEFSIEELKEEGKRNIEIAELCDKYVEEINQNIKNLNEILEIIKTRGDLNQQIDQLNSNDIESNQEKQRLSEIKTFIILSKKNNETDIETLERLIKESEEEKKQIIEKKDEAIELIKNIKEICKEDLENISNYKNGIKPKRKNNDNEFSKIIDRNSELNKKMKSYEKFGKFLTQKNKQDIQNIKEEQKRLELELDKVMPNVSEEVEFIEKKRKIELIASQDGEVKKYEDLIKEIDIFLDNKNKNIEKPKENLLRPTTDSSSNEQFTKLGSPYRKNTESTETKQDIKTSTTEQIEKKIKRTRPIEEVIERKNTFSQNLDKFLINHNHQDNYERVK